MKTILLLLLLSIFAPTTSLAADPKLTGAILVRLDDVYGVFGGQSLVLDADGNLFVRKVRGAAESRFHLQLPAEEVAGLLTFIASSGISDYRERERVGVPDESHPRITLTLPGQKKLEAAKWANDKDPQFDRLYQRLMEIVERAAKTPAYRNQPYDHRAAYPGNA